MKVFIENEAGSDQKNIFNETTLEYKKTYTVSRQYPFPYGFIPETTSGDGDCLDCFILIDKALKSGTTVEAEPIGLMEQVEDGEEDHKILAILVGESFELTDEVKAKLKDFTQHVFDHKEGKNMQVGNFFGREKAVEVLNALAGRRGVAVKKSRVEGLGVFAERDFKQGEIILVIDDTHVVADESGVELKDKDHLDYLDQGRVVLMQTPEVYINHSCDPNTYVKTIEGQRRVIAMRNIPAGEEITYDYAINGDYAWGAECHCGSENCRKVINPNFWELPLERQREYLPYLDNWFVEKHKEKVDALANAAMNGRADNLLS